MILVAQSMGGEIAVDVALAHPAKVIGSIGVDNLKDVAMTISDDDKKDTFVPCSLSSENRGSIGDAKQDTGLKDCQARSKEKRYTHFNLAFTAVSVAKSAYSLSLPEEQKEEIFHGRCEDATQPVPVYRNEHTNNGKNF